MVWECKFCLRSSKFICMYICNTYLFIIHRKFCSSICIFYFKQHLRVWQRENPAPICSSIQPFITPSTLSSSQTWCSVHFQALLRIILNILIRPVSQEANSGSPLWCTESYDMKSILRLTGWKGLAAETIKMTETVYYYADLRPTSVKGLGEVDHAHINLPQRIRKFLPHPQVYPASCQGILKFTWCENRLAPPISGTYHTSHRIVHFKI